MIGKVKDFFGIEGTQVELQLSAAPRRGEQCLRGLILLSSLRPQTVTGLHLRLEERYARGRGDERLINTYLLGELKSQEPIELAARELVELPFELSFSERLSPAEAQARRSPVLRPLQYLAAKALDVQSTYTLHCDVHVRGLTLQPRTTLPVHFE